MYFMKCAHPGHSTYFTESLPCSVLPSVLGGEICWGGRVSVGHFHQPRAVHQSAVSHHPDCRLPHQPGCHSRWEGEGLLRQSTLCLWSTFLPKPLLPLGKGPHPIYGMCISLNKFTSYLKKVGGENMVDGESTTCLYNCHFIIYNFFLLEMYMYESWT